MDTLRLKHATLLTVLLSIAVGAAPVKDDLVELQSAFNGRSEAKFRRADDDIVTTLPAHTVGKVVETHYFANSGNYGIKIHVMNGAEKDQDVWVHYRANPQDNGIALCLNGHEANAQTSADATCVQTREVTHARSVETNKPVAAIAPERPDAGKRAVRFIESILTGGKVAQALLPDTTHCVVAGPLRLPVPGVPPVVRKIATEVGEAVESILSSTGKTLHIPRAGDVSKTLRRTYASMMRSYGGTNHHIREAITKASHGEEPFGTPVPGTPFVRGKIAQFGGPGEGGDTAVLARATIPTGRHDRHGNPIYRKPRLNELGTKRYEADNCIAMRFDYQGGGYEQWSNVEFIVRAHGKTVRAVACDWGPNIKTGRIADLSGGLMRKLGVGTDDEVEIALARK